MAPTKPIAMWVTTCGMATHASVSLWVAVIRRTCDRSLALMHCHPAVCLAFGWPWVQVRLHVCD